MTIPNTYEQLETEALRVVESALKNSVRLYALMASGHESIVMLHLLKRAGGGMVPVPVVFVQQPGLVPGRLKFMDKLMRIWRLKMTVHMIPVKEGSPPYTERELADAGVDAVTKAGGGGVLLPWPGSVVADAAMPGINVYRPLVGFTEQDIETYVYRHRLPRPYETAPGLAGGKADTDADSDAVQERLKELGYM